MVPQLIARVDGLPVSGAAAGRGIPATVATDGGQDARAKTSGGARDAGAETDAGQWTVQSVVVAKAESKDEA